MKCFQVVNFQHQPVMTFGTLDAAKDHIEGLRTAYPDEGFYVVELPVVFSSYPAGVRPATPQRQGEPR